MGRLTIAFRRPPRLLAAAAGVLVAATLAGPAAEAAPGATARRAYRLEIEFTERYLQEIRAPGAGLEFRARTTTEVATDAVPVWLVRTGRRSARRYAITPRDAGGEQVRAQGPVTFSGSAREDIITPTGTCLATFTYGLAGPSSAMVDLTLRRTAIERLRIGSPDAVAIHAETTCSDGTQATSDITWGYGPINSPTSGQRAVLSAALGRIGASSVRFGRAFSISITHDPSNDPSLTTKRPEPVPGATDDETWRYTWRLEMTPAVKHH